LAISALMAHEGELWLRTIHTLLNLKHPQQMFGEFRVESREFLHVARSPHTVSSTAGPPASMTDGANSTVTREWCVHSTVRCAVDVSLRVGGEGGAGRQAGFHVIFSICYALPQLEHHVWNVLQNALFHGFSIRGVMYVTLAQELVIPPLVTLVLGCARIVLGVDICQRQGSAFLGIGSSAPSVSSASPSVLESLCFLHLPISSLIRTVSRLISAGSSGASRSLRNRYLILLLWASLHLVTTFLSAFLVGALRSSCSSAVMSWADVLCLHSTTGTEQPKKNANQVAGLYVVLDHAQSASLGPDQPAIPGHGLDPAVELGDNPVLITPNKLFRAYRSAFYAYSPD